MAHFRVSLVLFIVLALTLPRDDIQGLLGSQWYLWPEKGLGTSIKMQTTNKPIFPVNWDTAVSQLPIVTHM